MNLIIFYIAIILLGIGLFLFVSIGSKKKFDKKSSSYRKIEEQWDKIKGVSTSGDINRLKDALIVADKLVDRVLELKGYKGDTLALKAKAAKVEMGDCYEKFWDAHKTRNRLVHEIESDVRFYEAQKALEKFKDVISKLGAGE